MKKVFYILTALLCLTGCRTRHNIMNTRLKSDSMNVRRVELSELMRLRNDVVMDSVTVVWLAAADSGKPARAAMISARSLTMRSEKAAAVEYFQTDSVNSVAEVNQLQESETKNSTGSLNLKKNMITALVIVLLLLTLCRNETRCR